MIDNSYSVVPAITGEPNCLACGLDRKSAISIYGSGKRGILIVFDSQTSVVAISKSFGIGHQFTFIKNALYQYGIVAEDDCWVTSAIQCFSNTPTEKHMDCCRASLHKTIALLKPAVILTVGELATEAMLKDIISGSRRLDRTHGFIHNCRTFNCWMVATFVPGSDTRRNSVLDKIITRDIHLAVMALQKPYVAWKSERECVHTLTATNAVEALKTAIADTRARWEAIDYETTGLKPHNEAQELISCAIACNSNESYAFMVDDVTRPLLIEYLNAPQIKKIAHNMPFELMWSAVKLGTWGCSMDLDTMLLAHIIDNRDTYITSIKFLAPMLLGCPLWNEHISVYLEADKQSEELFGNNALNSIKSIQKRDLLIYNAIDSLVEYRCAMVMMRFLQEFGDSLPTPESVNKFSV